MHEFVFFNNQISIVSQANLSGTSSAALYGRGVFTTIAIKEKKAFLWEKHWRRLNDNAERIGIDLAEFSEDFLVSAIDDLTRENEIENAKMRITFFDESAGEIWKYETKKKTNLLIITADLQKVSDNFRLTISPFAVNSASPLAGVKSCNYLENILALDEAKKRGFDEAVRLNERGEITSVCMANIFWREGEKLFTPPLETGCLRGTTREFILENFPVIEETIELPQLIKADEIFLTSAGIGICPAYFKSIKEKNNSIISELKEILDLPEV